MIIIYKVTNSINNKVYIGQTLNFKQRKAAHLHLYRKGTTHFYRALRKYKPENFLWEIVAECNDRLEANKREKELINSHGGVGNIKVYNETQGGHAFAPRKFSKKERNKLSERAKKMKLNEIGCLPVNVEKATQTRKEKGVYKQTSIRQLGNNNSAKREVVRKKISSSVSKLWNDPKYRENQMKNNKKRFKIVKCPYCHKEGSKLIMSRHHFINCKFKV